ncbi:hypothetical protein R50073_01770 [Maricurvus nonylphenolicus]|uniref:CgeB family protein n=1 Tax=Maricurvus nonylphenolicus TaxID=1008307 RepID=UPI0036F20B20
MKILLVDGISGVSLGRDIFNSMQANGVSCHYISTSKDLPQKSLVKVKGAFAKLKDKAVSGRDFYYYPKAVASAFADAIEECDPDIVFVVGFLYRAVDLNLVANLKKTKKTKFVLYDTDSCNLFPYQREFTYFIREELPLYDKVFSFSKVTSEFYAKVLGLDAVYAPFGSNPIPVPSQLPAKDIDVLFVGSADMRRVFLLEKLTDFKLAIYGSRWDRHEPLMSDRLKSKVSRQAVWGGELYGLFHRSKVILNITRGTFYGVETGVNLRIPETLSANGFLLTDHTDELGSQYVVGETLESYRSSEELVEKVSTYLQNDVARAKIADQGHECWKHNYTWDVCVKRMLAVLQA